MATYNHGPRVQEEETAAVTPITGTAGLQVIFGTAPVNLAKDPYAAVNTPIICYDMKEFTEYFGYSNDFMNYTLCQSADMSFNVFGVAPIICINVLDPKVHKAELQESQYTVVDKQALVTVQGILLDKLVVKNADAVLTEGKDYVASFDKDGHVIITLIDGGMGDGVQKLVVSGERIAPEAVEKDDIIGGYDVSTGAETGIETLRQVYPRFGMNAGLLLAPRWSKYPEVAAVLQAKCEGLNGVFSCECILDIDTIMAKKYTDVKSVKEQSGFSSKHAIALWPCLKLGEKIYAYSATYGAMVAYTDASNDDVPNLSPSNKLIRVTGTVLEDGTEVVLDVPQANVLNGQGVVTAINDEGWRAWGNNTAAYPGNKDPKDRWICCRRFFSWWGNSFIRTYKAKVDDPSNKKLIEEICDSENIRGNSYSSQGKCAGVRIEFREEDNANAAIDGKMVFRQYLAPYPPAEDILDILSFDPEMLKTELS